jgi:hypothetical protein
MPRQLFGQVMLVVGTNFSHRIEIQFKKLPIEVLNFASFLAVEKSTLSSS